MWRLLRSETRYVVGTRSLTLSMWNKRKNITYWDKSIRSTFNKAGKAPVRFCLQDIKSQSAVAATYAISPDCIIRDNTRNLSLVCICFEETLIRLCILQWRYLSSMASQLTGYLSLCSTAYSAENHHTADRISSPLWRESTGDMLIPLTRASNAGKIPISLYHYDFITLINNKWHCLSSCDPWDKNC